MDEDIENAGGVLKITAIRVKYRLKAPEVRRDDAKACFSSYITRCPAVQSVTGCIRIEDELFFEN